MSDTVKAKNFQGSDLSLWFRTIGTIALFAGLFIYDSLGVTSILVSASILMTYAWSAIHYAGKDGAADERRVKISLAAALYSWYGSLFGMFVLLALDYAGGLHLSLFRFFCALVIIMVATMQGFNVYLGRRGDVE